MKNDKERLDWLNERYGKLSPLSFLDAFQIPYPKGRALRFGSIRQAIDYSMKLELPPLGPIFYKVK